MELNVYQKKAMETCMPTCENISYMLLNLVGEVGEFSSKIAKGIRKGEMEITGNALCIDNIRFTGESLKGLMSPLWLKPAIYAGSYRDFALLWVGNWKMLLNTTSRNSRSGKRMAR